MALDARKVALFCGLILVGCGGKSTSGEGAAASGGQGGGAGDASQGGVGQGGTAPSGQGGSQPGAMVTGGGPATGGFGAGGAGGASECVDGEENTCDCGGFSSCVNGIWSPCDCPAGACDNDATQSLDDYSECARNTCIAQLGTPGFAPCVERCAQDRWGVSADCSSCMAGLVECAATTCISKCLSDKDGSCDRCLCEQGCMQSARSCAGSNTDLPVCPDGS